MDTIEIDFAPVARGVYLEGLATDGDIVWFGDVLGGGLHRVVADGTIRDFLPERTWFGSIALDVDGRVLVSGVGGIDWLDPATGESGAVPTGVPGDQLSGVNELCPDGSGGLYFGSKDGDAIRSGTDPRPSGLYHLAPGGVARLLIDGLVFTNGLALSPDGHTLYHNETFVGTFGYPVLGDGGLGEPRQLLVKQDCDGMVLDRDGNLLISGFASGELIHLRPDGVVLGRLRAPGGAITNVRFGGADSRDLYLTCIPFGAGEKIRAGRPPIERESVLYRGRSPIPGRIAQQTRLPRVTAPA